MSKSFLKLVAIVLVAFGFVGCDEKKSPIEVQTYGETNWSGQLMYYIKIRAIADSVTIGRIVVNRGNCGDDEMDKTLTFGNTYSHNIGSRIEAFGGIVKGCSTDNVKEVQVFTDKGTWTFSF